VHTELGRSQVEVQQCTLEQLEEEAEEAEEEEAAEDEEEDNSAENILEPSPGRWGKIEERKQVRTEGQGIVFYPATKIRLQTF
jgi:hypothetical protein